MDPTEHQTAVAVEQAKAEAMKQEFLRLIQLAHEGQSPQEFSDGLSAFVLGAVTIECERLDPELQAKWKEVHDALTAPVKETLCPCCKAAAAAQPRGAA